MINKFLTIFNGKLSLKKFKEQLVVNKRLWQEDVVIEFDCNVLMIDPCFEGELFIDGHVEFL